MSLTQINQKKPLIHCITNYVVANFTANGLLAIGASPVMADAIEEVEEIVQVADGLLINIGTLNLRKIEAMEKAMKYALQRNIPIVLDPVGAGATSLRLQTAKRFLANYNVTLLRCNAGELAAIAGATWQSRGVDSGQGVGNLEQMAKDVAKTYHCLVIVTGETDILTDGEQVHLITGGHEKVTHITGTGCLLSAICTATLASTVESFQQLAKLLAQYKLAGECAFGEIGTYQLRLLNELEKIAEVGK